MDFTLDDEQTALLFAPLDYAIVALGPGPSRDQVP